MTDDAERAAEAAKQIGRMVNEILALAPEAGLYVGITIRDSNSAAARAEGIAQGDPQ